MDRYVKLEDYLEYQKVFKHLENTIRHLARNHKVFDDYKNYETRLLQDASYFDILIQIVFYSGFRAETVTNKLDIIRYHFPNYENVSNYSEDDIKTILKDPKMIKNERKIRACINNAKTFKGLIVKHGSFVNYIESFRPKESFENLILFKEEVEYKFEYLGGITSYHFLTDIGLPVLKPDRVITRIFKRIGLIENEKQLLKTVIQGKKISEATGYPIRYIDIILVKYGQVGEDKVFGIDGGICLESNPKCNMCNVKEVCIFKASNFT
jgi:DNA-3-methyladenine glycosylase I